MTSPASYPRVQFRELRSAWLWKNRGVVTAMALLTVGVLGATTAASAMWGPDFAATWYAIGALTGGFTVLVGAMLTVALLTHDAQALHQLRGAWGEENTTDELRRAQNRKLIWGWVDGVGLQRGDLDHFVVTRRGGLVVLDSKFRTDPNLTLTEQLAKDASRVRLRAEGVATTVLGGRVWGRRRASGRSVQVRAAVVVWGALQHEIVEVEDHHGVAVLPGRQLCSWLATLDGDVVTEGVALETLKGLHEFRLSARS